MWKKKNENICDGEFLKKQMWQPLALDTMHKIEQYTQLIKNKKNLNKQPSMAGCSVTKEICWKNFK